MSSGLRLERARARTVLLALMAATCIVAFTAGPVAGAGVGPNHCVDFDGTDLNELYHTNDSFVTFDCIDVKFGPMWRPVGYWFTAQSHEVVPPDYEPLGQTPAEDFLLKLESTRYVIDAGTDEEVSIVVDRDDLFTDRATLFETFDVVRYSARLPGLSLGEHVVDTFVTMSAEHWDGAGLEPGNHLPAGESNAGSTPVFVAEPSPEPHCSIDVTPPAGGPTDVYRLTASGVPTDPARGSVEVRIDVRRLGTHEGSTYIFFVNLVPGGTTFYVDLNQVSPEDPVEPMIEGRYLVVAETPDLAGGCYAVDRFVVA